MAPKMRDSCTSCATSKVKCSKERPTCARCAQRGDSCKYTASKRNGRNAQPPATAEPAADNRPGERDTNGVAEAPDSATTAPGSFSTFMDMDSCLMDQDMLDLSTVPSNTWSSVLSPPSSATNLAAPAAFPYSSTDLDDLFGSSTTLPTLNNSTAATPLQQQSNQAPSIAPTAVLGSSGSGQAFGQISDPIFDLGAPNPDIAYGNPSEFGSLPPKPSSSCCLNTALEFLTQLSPNASTACTFPGSQQKDGHIANIDTVISENKRILEALGNMLGCECSNDDYLIALICFILLKVIAWYDAAARRSMSSDNHVATKGSSAENRISSAHSEQVQQNPGKFGNRQLDGTSQTRMAAQQTLSELHRVQRLANHLSKHLEASRKSRRSRSNSTSSSATSSIDDLANAAYGSPLPNPIVDQLESDVRRRLRTVSCEIIDTLRKV